MVSTLVIALPASTPAVPATPSVYVAAGNNTPCSGAGAASRRTLASKPWTLAGRWEPWGLRGSLITFRKGTNYEYNIKFSISSPLARILGRYALTGCLSLESMSLFGNAFTFRHPSYFAVARVVDRSHPFMTACRHGDVETVRFMLRSGEGRPTDVTATGRTPMGVSRKIKTASRRCTDVCTVCFTFWGHKSDRGALRLRRRCGRDHKPLEYEQCAHIFFEIEGS
jgi:hypothetical protein